VNIRFFYHSLCSDWNNGNAHFLRGIMAELQARGHDVLAFEPETGWSRTELLNEQGDDALNDFPRYFPQLKSASYSDSAIHLDELLGDAHLVIVHEWTALGVIDAIGAYRRTHSHLRVFFHDTHHRAVTAPHEINSRALKNYDGILAYGKSLSEVYERNGWSRQVHVWHEAADTRVFYPHEDVVPDADLVWIGNWGDGERTAELEEFMLQPAHALGLSGNVFGVRYPKAAVERLAQTGLAYRGWLPNYRVPEVFARHRLTVHVPRGPYVRSLPGIPTIRPFEALACGIPMISAPWSDLERLFRPGRDFLMARNGNEMKRLITEVLHDRDLAAHLRNSGLETIRTRHTCAHRVDELLNIYSGACSHRDTAKKQMEVNQTCKSHFLARA
jgi:spore maturation protein CgeB